MKKSTKIEPITSDLSSNEMIDAAKEMQRQAKELVRNARKKKKAEEKANLDHERELIGNMILSLSSDLRQKFDAYYGPRFPDYAAFVAQKKGRIEAQAKAKEEAKKKPKKPAPTSPPTP